MFFWVTEIWGKLKREDKRVKNRRDKRRKEREKKDSSPISLLALTGRCQQKKEERERIGKTNRQAIDTGLDNFVCLFLNR